MAFEIPADLNPALTPIAWLIGRWQGNGHGNWPGVGDFEFGQRIDFATNRGPYLHYLSQTWTLDADGQPDAPLAMETGFWRPAGASGIEVVLTSPEGWVEVWVGALLGAKIELTTDLAQPVAAYSHGMKQKLAIISAWLHEPKLILMDEPFVGLDPKASHILKGMMREVCDAGGAIFFSTHVLEVAEKLCDKVAIIKGGKLIRSGTMEEVKGDDSLEEVFLELEGESC